ncbi:RagB/SusD family nutrient uptake outer membrane protein [Aquimarina sp. AD1]|uniref:RagB/SusD family nutrient uptake outer membrane protein n=1 Tax=Aquimarina sp. (strain AD1) TaxID=1714848 RepID=UPI000E466D26|nr:RagB/SusD family nutrient uptake outer membrane protein [Aquimarina sp. AD1]AXT56767.1 RagB/SusD family nutrient uptake outer membrane protein [Aquimarina sp. AD1]RKN13891.1 RagB/SusD family nutrient uptake outer membrane protein [Aquimarina sp. AD1]
MKIKNNLKTYITAILGIIILSGCELDVDNPNAVTEETFWRTSNDFDAALTTVYGALQFQGISGSGLAFEMLLGDEAGTENFYRQIEFASLNFGDASEQVVDKWNELYIGIFRANQVLEQLPLNIDVFDDPEEAIIIEAQARFLRAFYHFQVAHSYGGAVIRTSVPRTSEEIATPFSSIEEVTNQVIIPDLIFAKENLPEAWPSADLGRITWGAATALLGKTYLYSEQWEQAANQFREVIDSNIYSLAQNNLDNFSHLTEFNTESILETPYSVEFNPGANGNIVDNNTFETGAEASGVAQSMGQLQFGAFNVVLPTYYLHELFVRDEIDPNNPINDGNMQSKRMGASIVPVDGDGLYYGLPINDKPGWVFGQSSYAKKYSNWYHLESEDGNSRSEINFRHIRLADVYLMYAEAVLEANGDIDTAIEFIDRIRRRAGVITLRQYIDDNGGFPQFHVSEQVNGIQPFVTPSAETIMKHLRRVERPLELCFEGHRWKDLVRWGIAGDVLNELVQDELWREANFDALDIGGVGVAPLFIREKLRRDFGIASQNYNSAVHDYFPIPAAELQTNDEIGN